MEIFCRLRELAYWRVDVKRTEFKQRYSTELQFNDCLSKSDQKFCSLESQHLSSFVFSPRNLLIGAVDVESTTRS